MCKYAPYIHLSSVIGVVVPQNIFICEGLPTKSFLKSFFFNVLEVTFDGPEWWKSRLGRED